MTQTRQVLALLLVALFAACSGAPEPHTGQAPVADVEVEVGADVDLDTTDALDDPLVDPAPDVPTEDVRPDTPPMTVDAPTSVASWVLLSADPETVVRNLDAAVAFGVGEVQLSHDLVSRLSELRDEALLSRLRAAMAEADARGLRVLIWSNEFDGTVAVCFDPADPIWAARRQAYRHAFELLPGLDGVVLTFGSANPPPWLAGCVCGYCLDLPSDEPPATRPFMVPPPPTRIRQIVENVHDLVTGELGQLVYVRTFIHEPVEQAWMLEGLSAIASERTFVQMSKDVPNDWQPYYPLDPAIGAVPGRPVVMEVDAAGEYWGLSELPFPAVGYFERRVRAARERGAIGYAARVERGSSSSLATPNEVNLRAMATFFEDPAATPAEVYAAWLPGRYGVSDPEALTVLATLHERAFDVARKMFYQLGFWTLEKGSGLPDSCRAPALLDSRANDAWDPRWAPLHERLANPDRATLDALRQEDREALALADRNLTELDALIADGVAGGEAIMDLRRRLSKQRFAVQVWMEAVEGIWAHVLFRQTGDLEHAGWVASAADRLEDALAAFQAAHPGDLTPLSANAATACAASMRTLLPAGVEPIERPAPTMAPLEIEIADGELVVHVAVDEPATVEVSVGADALEPLWSVEDSVPSGEHTVRLALPADPPLWLSVQATAHTMAGSTVEGSDYLVRTE